jgi:hypothetical protein
MDDRRVVEGWFGSRRGQRCFSALQQHWDPMVLLFNKRCLSAVRNNLLKVSSGQNSPPSFLLKNGVADFPDYLSVNL